MAWLTMGMWTGAAALAWYLSGASAAFGETPNAANNQAGLQWKSRRAVSPPTAAPQKHSAQATARPMSSARTAQVAFRHDPQVVQVRAEASEQFISGPSVVQAQAVDDPLRDPFGDRSKTAPSTVTPPTPSQLSPLNVPLPMPTPAPTAPGDLRTLPALPGNDQMAVGNSFRQEPCPDLNEFKKIGAITNRIAASSGDLPNECVIDERVEASINRDWGYTLYTWKASGLCHKPLYFEEEALERYGHSTGPLSQPFVSGAMFFGTLPILPYKMGMDPPWECKYALGYYRPGSCAPYIIPGVPISAQGIAAQTAATLGAIYLLP